MLRFHLNVAPEEFAFHMPVDEAAAGVFEGTGDPGSDAGVGVHDLRDEAVPGEGALQAEITGLTEQKGDALTPELLFFPAEGVDAVFQTD